jgi:hypothetical protein
LPQIADYFASKRGLFYLIKMVMEKILCLTFAENFNAAEHTAIAEKNLAKQCKRRE